MHRRTSSRWRGLPRFLRARGDAPVSPVYREGVNLGFRARGDAPLPGPAHPGAQSVPPRTRRCTLDLEFEAGEACGSSAHAEMHPPLADYSARAARFLRARGDAPSGPTARSCGSRVPPRTRRCTRVAPRAHPRFHGSSAHAEMHPMRPMAENGPSWFLRARGDAPECSNPAAAAVGVPPRTRRCTRGDECADLVECGSSAHAEMHRMTVRARRPVLGSSAHAEMHPHGSSASD